MKKFSAIIFDMDGVIVDSEPLHQQAFEALFAELGKKHDHGIVFPEYYGRSDGALLRDFIGKHKLPHEMEDLSARKLKYFLGYLRERRPVFKELHVLVPELAKRYQLAVATSSTHHVADVVMEISGLGPHFRLIVAREDVRFPKPDPEVYFTAARKLGVRPSACCVIEDTSLGVQAAKTAGMTCIGLTTSLPPEKLSHADHIARNYEDVRKLLL
ncbi:MAG TPA: HAD family phosphatase [Verrucomicrobiae bacterium]|nr:HAD family phosphatase [Verrucomicrobiae bacterium]